MKRFILLWGLAILCLCPNISTHAAISSTFSPPVFEKKSSKNLDIKKAKKLEKRLSKMEKKLSKKKNRFRKKGKFRGRIGLDFIGLTVLVVGGLFIWAGLAIPFVGWLFVGIGALVALVGLLLLFLLGGISVNVD